MILETGNMWSVFGTPGALWCFTGNSVLNSKRELVMGAGLALEVKKRFPDVPAILGTEMDKARLHPIYTPMRIYGIRTTLRVCPDSENGFYLGVFQVKRHWKDNAEYALIGHSVLRLQEWIRMHDLERVDLNMPGTGCGRLTREHVLPIISELPDCVHVWEGK